jgi:hypothetical protein
MGTEGRAIVALCACVERVGGTEGSRLSLICGFVERVGASELTVGFPLSTLLY